MNYRCKTQQWRASVLVNYKAGFSVGSLRPSDARY
jgi:hypothetical protein